MTKQEFKDALIHLRVHGKFIVIPTLDWHIIWKQRPDKVIRDLKEFNPLLQKRKFKTHEYVEEKKYIIYREE